MKIELTQYQENEDGSVNCHVDMDKQAAHHLINYALVNMLTTAAKEGKLYTPELPEAVEEIEEEDNTTWVELEPEQIDSILVAELKRCLINTYHNTSTFQEDIDNNTCVRIACKELLSYYMIPSEADAYIDKVEAIYEC